ncbi:CAP domain-containing protein [Luteolibacter luteus]|uniref:CAP domain-containing protein n=1 Tax=Luteolibacter luteus TaxID=2728835 RepID=A0A858RC46_9BACT|nr:CAP domain-containing protein [Luteolibacter luteus]QJE94357.1 CAP domain-containing protein [Luteolibacter luteus]
MKTPCFKTCSLALLASASLIGVGGAQQSFTPNAKELELYRIVRDDPQQQRTQVILDPRLCLAARKHAQDTQARKFFDHRNPSGVWSNERVLNEGYPLPSNYAPNTNYVESMAGSTNDTPAQAMTLWKSDVPHSNHLLGKTDFYRGQVVLGIGQAPKSGLSYATYVFISAPLPVGENGTLTAAAAAKLVVKSDAVGNLILSGPQPKSIIEVNRSTSLGTWTFDRVVVLDATGKISLGPKPAAKEFYRFGYYQP